MQIHFHSMDNNSLTITISSVPDRESGLSISLVVVTAAVEPVELEDSSSSARLGL
jgi:hypothetical protein